MRFLGNLLISAVIFRHRFKRIIGTFLTGIAVGIAFMIWIVPMFYNYCS